MKIFFVILLFIQIKAFSFHNDILAGQEFGNGGNVIVCFKADADAILAELELIDIYSDNYDFLRDIDDKIDSVTFFDIYVAHHHNVSISKDLNYASLQRLVRTRLSSLGIDSIELFDEINDLKIFFKADVPVVADIGRKMAIYPNCRLIQLAYNDYLHEFLIVNPIFHTLLARSPLNYFAFQIHEALLSLQYKKQNTYFETTVKVQDAVGLLLSSESYWLSKSKNYKTKILKSVALD